MTCATWHGIEQNKSSSKLTENEIREYYNKALSRKAPLLINILIKEIILYDDKMKIKLYSPIKKSPDDNGQGVLFYETITHISYTNNYTHKEIINTIRIELYL